MVEAVARTIIDPVDPDNRANVAEILSNPGKYGLVVTNADGSAIGSAGSVGKYTLLLDDYTTTNVTYIGIAAPGTLVSQAKRSIFKMDETTGLTKYFADSGNFSQIRNNRVSLTYA